MEAALPETIEIKVPVGVRKLSFKIGVQVAFYDDGEVAVELKPILRRKPGRPKRRAGEAASVTAARRFLIDFLGEAAREAAEVQMEAIEVGISKRSLQDASQALNVKKTLVYSSDRSYRSWMWSLK